MVFSKTKHFQIHLRIITYHNVTNVKNFIIKANTELYKENPTYISESKEVP